MKIYSFDLLNELVFRGEKSQIVKKFRILYKEILIDKLELLYGFTKQNQIFPFPCIGLFIIS